MMNLEEQLATTVLVARLQRAILMLEAQIGQLQEKLDAATGSPAESS